MKNLVTTLSALALAVLLVSPQNAAAQWSLDNAPYLPLIFSFESLEEDTLFINNTYVTSPDTENEFFEFAALDPGLGIDASHGDDALVVNWSIKADQSYGASMGMAHQLPSSYLPDSTDRLYDFSDFTHFEFDYNALVAAEFPGQLSLRVKLADASLGVGTAPGDETEDWTAQAPDSPLGAAAGWTTVSLPLENLGLGTNPAATGFSRPGCAPGGDPLTQSGCWSGLLGNEKFDLDQISAIQFEFFAGTGLATAADDRHRRDRLRQHAGLGRMIC